MTRLQQKLQAIRPLVPVSPYQERREELSRLPAKDRIAEVAADLRALPREVSDEIVFHHKKLLRILDAARIETGSVTPMDVQRENSPVSFEQMEKATLTFRPRLRA